MLFAIKKNLITMGLKQEWLNEIRNNWHLILLSFILLLFASLFNYLAGIYVSQIPGTKAPDLILDNIPTFDLNFIYLYGAVFIGALLFFYPLFLKVKKFHVVISQFSLLIMVRGIFICLTHLSIPAGALQFHVPEILFILSFNNDLFFSGHTAIPFLGFLLFKGDKIRYFFLFFSFFMGAVVLLMHVHYTIDVFSAFFITYGTHKAGEKFFNKVNAYLRR
jgi:hypothetical protein